MATTVVDNSAEHRFEIRDGDTVAGFVVYRASDALIELTHTEVDPAFQGRGLGRQLVSEVLAVARRRGQEVLPMCPYVRQVIARNPDATWIWSRSPSGRGSACPTDRSGTRHPAGHQAPFLVVTDQVAMPQQTDVVAHLKQARGETRTLVAGRSRSTYHL